MADELFHQLIAETSNEYATIAEDGIIAGDVAGYIDTGSYSLNALLSGSIYKGLASNKVTALAGEPSTGKTFYALAIAKHFLDQNPTGFVMYFESESAVSKAMMAERGIDISRVAVIPVETVEQFRTQALKVINKYLEGKSKPPMLFILDSLGNLSTEKEVEDIAAGKATKDMSRPSLIKAAFRVLTLKLGKANVPMIVTNHVYESMNMYSPGKKMGGGDGLPYAASTIIFLSKRKDKDKDTKEVSGVIITATLKKARLTKEDSKVETLLNFDTGLDPYYGLLSLAEKFGIFKKLSKQYELPDGKKVFEKTIVENPEKYFTPEILDEIEKHCAGEFLYGRHNWGSGGDEEETSDETEVEAVE